MLLKNETIHVIKELFATHLYVLKRNVFDHIINVSVYMVSMTLVNSYLMPAFGLSIEYSSFIVAGLCASAGLFGIIPNVATLVSDFKGDQIYTYYLTLPMPSWIVFFLLIFYYALNFSILGILVLPIGKLLIWERLSLVNFSLGKFGIIFILVHFFYGALTLWIASRIPDMTKISNAWMRCVYPLWFLGCFQFSWIVLYKESGFFAYLNLLNPITYMMEGMRAAILGQAGYLNFWFCASMLMMFIIAFSWRALKLMKRRLDFV